MRRSLAPLHAVAGVLMIALLVELARRVAFPWDFLIRFESGFMTDMLKLHNGRALFQPPTDLNTTVYAPAQELFTYGLLRPLGVDLDVRFCRLVAVALGFAAAATAACIAARGGKRVFAFAVAALLLFRNFTADAPHPANLHALHALALLALGERALARGSVALASAAMAVAGLGPLVKLEAAFAPLGVAAVLLAARWPARRLLLPLAVGLVVWGAAAGFVLRSPDARAFLLPLLARHRDPRELWNLALLVRGHVLLLGVLAFPSALELWRGDGASRRLLAVWLAIGATDVLPVIAGYPLGTSDVDAFGIVGLWAFVVVWPCLAERYAGEPPGVLATTVIALLLVLLVPKRLPPPPGAYRYAERLEAAIAGDVAAGRRVLLAHGTMPLIRAGLTSVPRDRADAVDMAFFTRPAALAGLTTRLQAGLYDRIYANTPGYALTPAVQRHYRQVDVIERPELFPYTVDTVAFFDAGYRDRASGWDAAMYDVTVLERIR